MVVQGVVSLLQIARNCAQWGETFFEVVCVCTFKRDINLKDQSFRRFLVKSLDDNKYHICIVHVKFVYSEKATKF